MVEELIIYGLAMGSVGTLAALTLPAVGRCDKDSVTMPLIFGELGPEGESIDLSGQRSVKSGPMNTDRGRAHRLFDPVGIG